MNKIVGLITVLASYTLQVNAQKIEQIRAVADFTGIKVGDMFDVKLKQAENNSVSINADEAKQANIKTEVSNGILSIISDGKDDFDATITVGVKSLNSIKITGMADVKSENQLKCNQLNIESNGAGSIDLDVNAKEIISDISGIGDVIISGVATFHTSKVSGTGSLRASNLETDKSVVKVSGVGDAKVNAKQTIDADVSGAGSIIYKGNPAERIINISGIGSVRESKNGTGDETASDTTKFKFGNKKYTIIGDENIEAKDTQRTTKHSFKHWKGFELGVNGLLNYKNSLDLPPVMELNYQKSYQFGLNLFEKDFHVYKNYVNIVTGLGFDFNHYAFRNNLTLGSIDFLAASARFNDSLGYKKNTLNISYLKIPLLLEFNTSNNPDKNIHFAIGGEFAYRIHSVLKQKWETYGENKYKMKQREYLNLEPFRYSLTARVGYNNVTLYANYSLNRLFKKYGSPQLYPFSLGVCIAVK